MSSKIEMAISILYNTNLNAIKHGHAWDGGTRTICGTIPIWMRFTCMIMHFQEWIIAIYIYDYVWNLTWYSHATESIFVLICSHTQCHSIYYTRLKQDYPLIISWMRWKSHAPLDSILWIYFWNISYAIATLHFNYIGYQLPNLIDLIG